MAAATFSHVKQAHLYQSRQSIAFTILIIVTCLCATVQAECKRNQFTCHDGSCILQEKMCDGHRDCPDNSDELKCDMKNCKEPHWFECAQPLGPCLSADLVCDGYENCPGGEDELACKDTHKLDKILSFLPRNCSKFEYTCSDKTCIPLDFMCDGKKDCADNSDETLGCEKARTSCQGFFCDNNKCLESKNWICDGVNDCLDGSDERHCMSKCTTEAGKFACHNNKTCIELSQVCDGISQCTDESDESNLCQKCTQKVCPPAAKCYVLKHDELTCICPKGYRLSELENKCVDIDECVEMHGLCSQKCTNTPGSYKCLCDKGYNLRADNHSCKALEEHAVLLYTTQVTVMSLELRSKRVQTVAGNLSKVIGVAFDGTYIYWTNLENEAESIVRANLDGSEQEILLTSGLDAPEDLAVDWLTGNVYFTDHNLQHIAVCSNDGIYCTILVTKNVHQPRGLALWPQLGQMFWTDWGDHPMIARSAMDGSNMQMIVSENIYWPNGIALDMHNNRVYWVDAKLGSIESARPDGTDRRLVLEDVLKHPYGLAIFEEKLYWSDWGTKSVHSCNKFTGKNHQVEVRDRTIYAVHIYHKAKQPHTDHACIEAHCSHLCLLTENHTYSCACPYDMELSEDQHRCVKMKKKQKLFIGVKNTILEIEHNTFGRDIVESSHLLPVNVDEMVYNSVNGTLIIADNMRRVLYEYDMLNSEISALISDNLGNITSLAFDHLSNNVYWTDSERHSIEVFSMQTHQRAIVTFFSGQEKPIALTVIPDDGIMFVALKNRRLIHIDQLTLSGRGDHVHVVDEILGNRDLRFAVDYDNAILYWTDSELGRVSFSHYRSFQAYTFRSRLHRPYDLAIVDGDLFWSELKSSNLHWTHLSNEGPLKRINIEATKDSDILHNFPSHLPLAASKPRSTVPHPCQHNNGGCSHICTSLSLEASACLCPPGLVFKDLQNRTCIELLDCEFRCVSGECLTMAHRCNSHKDCADGSDEKNCETDKIKTSIICQLDEFQCHNAKQCVNNDQRCDGKPDCKDRSDETHCEKFDSDKKCHQHQFACHNSKCVDLSAYCDGNNDCEDNSDEENCDMTNNTNVCAKDMFQCSRGSCIPKKWECDGKLDCTDGSDEHIACGLRDCAPNMHRCLLGQCIDEKLKCDGHNDCGDFSDEMNCGGFNKKLSHVCADHEFQCRSNASICLKMSAKCNGTAECPRGEDEADCGEMCSINEFHCKNSKECIRKEFHCDHELDCADGSDELHCHFDDKNNSTSVEYSHFENVCESGMFDCKDNTCVEQSSVCNNFDDCANGADESPLCKTACTSHVCAHKCRAMPTGALCSCFPGYKLDTDKRGCLDINECDLNPCAQICENTRGSYRCSCYPDYMLRADKVTCKSIESNASLYFVSYNEVRSMSEHPITLKVAFTANDSKVQGFDIDVHRRLAYFTTAEGNNLYSVNMQTGALGTTLTLESPTKVSVDWITGNVYVINRAQHYQISVCSFQKRMCGAVISMPRNEYIKALTIDSFNRKMFYATMHTLTYGLTFSQVSVASLDGSQRKHLVTLNGGYITALGVDTHKQQLYFVDSHTKTLQTISYRAGDRSSAKTLLQSKNVVSHTTGLTIYENEAFLVNVGSKEAIRCFLFADFTCHSFNINVLNAEDIVVDGLSRQPLAKNPCMMANCKGMCIQAEYSYECMCGDEIVPESHICNQLYRNDVSLIKYGQESSQAGNKGHSMLTIILLLILLIIIAIGYFFYRRMAQGHRDFNINLHFQNPLSSTVCGSKPKSNSYIGASKNCDQEWEKIRFGLPTIQRLLQGKGKNTGTEMLLQTPERNEVCALGETGQPNVMVHENYVKYDASGAARDEANSRLVTDLI